MENVRTETELQWVLEENHRLRQQVAELAEAFTVIWVSDDRSAWDGKAVEHFDALMAKVGAGQTATKGHNAKVTGAEGVRVD